MPSNLLLRPNPYRLASSEKLQGFGSGYRIGDRVSRLSSKLPSGSGCIRSPRQESRAAGKWDWAWVSTSVSNLFSGSREQWEWRAFQEKEQPSGSPFRSMLNESAPAHVPVSRRVTVRKLGEG